MERSPGTAVVLLERDAIALVAAARNVAGCTRVLGSGLAHVQGPFDLIVSNPPIHLGGAQSLATVEALIREAPSALRPRGAIMLVAQRRLPIPALLARSFRDVRTVADGGPSASGPPAHPAAEAAPHLAPCPAPQRPPTATARRGRSARPPP